ncbi:MAG: matrixin family metalloprotease [Desulfurellaceae bacterium]|nr:matrixin family metalloprotease [Desulfurellaceae bacterium]
MSSKATPIRPWGRRLCAVLLPLLLVLVWWLHDSLAFVQITAPSGDGARWSDSQATLNLRLGCRTAAEGGNLPLYGPCWDDAAEDAAERWNAVEAGFEFHIQSPSQPADPSCGTADGINTVVWADTNCGMAWGDETLAVTQYLGRTYAGTAEFTDTDVLFNPTYSWSTYSGSWRVDVEDLHRVAIHEFGHVLGLGHPDDHGQSVNAIMNSKTTWGPDRLQADDIVGIRSIYGGDIIVVSDDHGDTRQDALEERGDEDYFRLSVLRSGTLTVETTGSIDTRGTLYSASGSFLTSDDDSGSGGNFQIVHQVSAGTYYVKVRGWRILQETGPYTLRVRFTASSGGGSGNRGTLENPGLGAFKSGVGVISGWVCDATRVEVEIAGSRLTAAYGTDRADTRAACGDTDNGFAILVNWNIFGAGSHTARLLVDGTEFARSTFQVTTFGQEVLQGARKTVTVRDFPRTGSIAVLEWEESSQNFVIREVRLTGSQPRLNDLLGTWEFEYILGSRSIPFAATYRLSRVDTSTGTPLVMGTDVHDDPVRAGRTQDILPGSTLRYEFALFEPWTSYHCKLFLFDKTGTDRVKGVYFLVDVHNAVQNEECNGYILQSSYHHGDPHPMVGTRTSWSTANIQEQSYSGLQSLEETTTLGLSSPAEADGAAIGGTIDMLSPALD